MDKYSRYYGVFVFVAVIVLSIVLGYKLLSDSLNNMNSINSELTQKEQEYNKKLDEKRNVERKLAQMKTSRVSVQKKIYSPVESDLGDDTLFFTLYNDLLEMVHSNGVKIKSMQYSYNPDSDNFVKYSKDLYFVCDINMELVSNYTNLGKLIQDVVQYPYYIRINSLDVKPYAKDKKILVSNMNLRLYAHTAPEASTNSEE